MTYLESLLDDINGKPQYTTHQLGTESSRHKDKELTTLDGEILFEPLIGGDVESVGWHGTNPK